jgi:hypothetical protein
MGTVLVEVEDAYGKVVVSKALEPGMGNVGGYGRWVVGSIGSSFCG